MVYLLHAHFGRDGREEAEALLERHSGDPDNPRILNAFNEKTSDWLSFLAFTYFTDRDGKYQLGALAESAFDPLSRTCEFMLREEAHHMFVGATGMGRVAQRTCEVMVENDTDDVRPFGVVDLPTLQKYINFHYAVSLDLFGAEASTNGANFYTAGLKGRFDESAYDDDHVLTSTTFACTEVVDGALATVERPSLQVVNLQLRDSYSDDCEKGLRRWNRLIAEAGVDFELTLPHPGFNRAVGVFAPHDITPDGSVVSRAEWEASCGEWLPTDDDRDYITSLMSPVYEPGRMAGWIAPPARGVNTRPVEYDYVRL